MVYSIFIGPKNSRLHRRKGILGNFSFAKPKCRCRIWSCYASSSLSQGCGAWRGGCPEWELWCGKTERLAEGEGGEKIWVLCHCLKASSKHHGFQCVSCVAEGETRRRTVGVHGHNKRRKRGKKWSNQVPFYDSFLLSKDHSIKLYSQNINHSFIIIHQVSFIHLSPPITFNLPWVNNRKIYPLHHTVLQRTPPYIHLPSSPPPTGVRLVQDKRKAMLLTQRTIAE